MALRRTPLARNTPLRNTPKATTYERPQAPPMNLDAARNAMQNQAASATAPRRDHAPVPDPAQRAPKPRDSGFPHATRQAILDRDTPTGEDRPHCQRCGRAIIAESWLGYSIQHRDNRGMGGTSDPRINWTSNGTVLCGSATTGCHRWAERDEGGEATREGFVVRGWADPETVPVHTYEGWVLLSRDGRKWPTKAPFGGDSHSVALRKANR